MPTDHWQSFYERQAKGEIPYNREFYIIDQPVQVGSAATVQLVTPTEQQVEQARSAVKHKLAAKPKVIAVKRRKKKVLKGGRKPIKKRKTEKKTIKRRK